MADQQNLKDAMIELLREEFSNRPAIVCRVLEVNGTKVKVQAVTDRKIYSDVRLQAHPGNGVLLIPTVSTGEDNGFIILQWLSDTAGYVAMYSDVDSIQLLDGSHGGLIKISELVDKLNVLEQRMTAHEHLYIPYPGGVAGSPVPTTTDPSSNPDITETTVADLENPDITHGG